MKKSTDGGKTWGPLKVFYKEEKQVIGQATPVQLKNGRILMPFNRNNKDCLLSYSDDDGETWSPPKPMDNCTHSNWSWIGFGPPASIQLESGRILIPSYHSYGPPLNGLLSQGHMVISDDNGETWRINKDQDFKNMTPWANSGGWKQFPPSFIPLLPNESQAVDLGNNKVLVAHRNAVGIRRIQTYSEDGGETFGNTEVVNILAPVTGCQDSIWYSKAKNALY